MKNPCCCPVCKVAGVLVVTGAINWGLVGGFNFNLVSKLVGAGTTAEKVIYIIIGVAGAVKLLGCFITLPCSKMCKAGDAKDQKEGSCGGGH